MAFKSKLTKVSKIAAICAMAMAQACSTASTVPGETGQPRPTITYTADENGMVDLDGTIIEIVNQETAQGVAGAAIYAKSSETGWDAVINGGGDYYPRYANIVSGQAAVIAVEQFENWPIKVEAGASAAAWFEQEVPPIATGLSLEDAIAKAAELGAQQLEIVPLAPASDGLAYNLYASDISGSFLALSPQTGLEKQPGLWPNAGFLSAFKTFATLAIGSRAAAVGSSVLSAGAYIKTTLNYKNNVSALAQDLDKMGSQAVADAQSGAASDRGAWSLSLKTLCTNSEGRIASVDFAVDPSGAAFWSLRGNIGGHSFAFESPVAWGQAAARSIGGQAVGQFSVGAKVNVTLKNSSIEGSAVSRVFKNVTITSCNGASSTATPAFINIKNMPVSSKQSYQQNKAQAIEVVLVNNGARDSSGGVLKMFEAANLDGKDQLQANIAVAKISAGSTKSVAISLKPKGACRRFVTFAYVPNDLKDQSFVSHSSPINVQPANRSAPLLQLDRKAYSLTQGDNVQARVEAFELADCDLNQRSDVAAKVEWTVEGLKKWGQNGATAQLKDLPVGNYRLCAAVKHSADASLVAVKCADVNVQAKTPDLRITGALLTLDKTRIEPGDRVRVECEAVGIDANGKHIDEILGTQAQFVLTASGGQLLAANNNRVRIWQAPGQPGVSYKLGCQVSAGGWTAADQLAVVVAVPDSSGVVAIPSGDADGDGYSVDADDCNDNDGRVNPGQRELCGDGLDNDCDGHVDQAAICAESQTDAPSLRRLAPAKLQLASAVDFVFAVAGVDYDGLIFELFASGDNNAVLTTQGDVANGLVGVTLDIFAFANGDYMYKAQASKNGTRVGSVLTEALTIEYPDVGDCLDLDGDGFANSACGGNDCDDGDAELTTVCIETDATPPQTTIDSGPSGTDSSASATFTFSCNEASCTFECQLDDGGYTTCSSPKTYNSLANGSRTFEVRAKDAANNVDATPASRTWTVSVSAGGGSGTHWVSIPAGTFTMGDAFSEGYLDELPTHSVTLSAFEMYAYEVTNGEYADCVAASQCTAPASSSSYSRSSYYGNAAYANYPVIYVNWQQASDFCSYIGGRLPTEAEWEYAARGGLSGKRFPWGDTIDCSKTNYYTYDGYAYDVETTIASQNFCVGDTTQVGAYAANGYGLYDMTGNVWEWVGDWYGGDFYSSSSSNNPQGPASGSYRVLRGGSFSNIAYDARVASRVNDSPTSQNNHIGFRCVR